ncbi:hypothetical protein QN277_007945 [Acacia crassicarpa]|nr:hypothetical protein QN277_007945 [Acacia crassicarpa]
MSFSCSTPDMYLSLAISVLLVLYLFLLALDSSWSNRGVAWLPQDSSFPCSYTRHDDDASYSMILETNSKLRHPSVLDHAH